MTIESILIFSGALFVAAIIPGPGILALVGCTLAQGSRRAFGFLAGLVLGDVTYLIIAITGLAALASAMGEAFVVIKLAGASFLVYTGIKMWRARPPADGSPPGAPSAKGSAAVNGYLVTLGNPKTMAFYLGVLPGIMELDGLVVADATMLASAAALTLVLACGPYIIAANRARTLIRSPNATRRMGKISGAILVGAGGAVAAT